MLECPEMAKNFANMTHAERLAALARDLHSPACVEKADEILELIKHEWREIYGVRESAAIRHGKSSPAPSMPIAPDASQGEGSSRERRPAVGTVGKLVRLYRNDERSSYSKLRFKTREFYENLIKRILIDCGDDKLADIKSEDINRLCKGWSERGTAMGQALLTMFRTLIYFGSTILQDGECDRLSLVLHRTRKRPAHVEPRNKGLTAEQATQTRSAAHEINRASIALAQAFQFDCRLPQKDVIGEWVPITESEESEIIDAENNNKWLRGLRWEEIDENLVLTHKLSKNQKVKRIDLKLAGMVLEELRLIFGGVVRDRLPASGPIIISEVTKRPWYPVEFRKHWRLAADKAGVPRTVMNRDSRAGSKSKRGEDDDKREVDISLELGERPSLPH